jgi:hypothetical protein
MLFIIDRIADELVSRKENAGIAFYLRKLSCEGPGGRRGSMAGGKFIAADLFVRVYPVYPSGIREKPVIAKLVLYIQADEDHAGQSNGEPADIDGAADLVSDEVPPGELEIVPEHRSLFDTGVKIRCQIDNYLIISELTGFEFGWVSGCAQLLY